ncbi:hypothetical protein N431DRAFT_427739 [Stipitochalara longipes BDJ]|nr:hypothetical protein N431DRAFT_427739 [Stipitochalara longipes BDJ]
MPASTPALHRISVSFSICICICMHPGTQVVDLLPHLPAQYQPQITRALTDLAHANVSVF